MTTERNIHKVTSETQTEKVPARLHAILARRGSNAVVFRRGPSDKAAVIGWDRSNDTFTLGQWLRGRIYPLRCDLSPSGKYLIYFAAKYGRENPMEKRICEELKKRFRTSDLRRVDQRMLAQAEEELRQKKEYQKMEKSADCHDCSWTAVSILPWNSPRRGRKDSTGCRQVPPEQASRSNKNPKIDPDPGSAPLAAIAREHMRSPAGRARFSGYFVSVCHPCFCCLVSIFIASSRSRIRHR